jgi:hypothetical protein
MSILGNTRFEIRFEASLQFHSFCIIIAYLHRAQLSNQLEVISNEIYC